MLSILRRRWWVILTAVLVGIAAAVAVALIRGPRYTAEGTAVITVSPILSVTPDQADSLAITDASFIPQDSAIARRVATVVGSSPLDVKRRISVTATPQTGLLTVDYQGTSRHNAIKGATAVLNAISGPRPASANIAPTSIGVVAYPVKASASNGVAVLAGIGFILGLLLGLVLAFTWERSDPRIEGPEDLSAEAQAPASPLASLSPVGAGVLIDRWRELAAREPVVVGLVPATDDVEGKLPEMAARLSRVATSAGVSAEVREAKPNSGHEGRDHSNGAAAVLVPCGVPSGDLTSQATIAKCDLTVLVARRGTRRTDLRTTLDALSEFEMSPKWALLSSRRMAYDGSGEATLK